MPITIVTCLLYISDKDKENFEHIEKLICDFTFLTSIQGLSFLIYTNNDYYTQLHDAFSMFSHVLIVNIENDNDIIPLSILDCNTGFAKQNLVLNGDFVPVHKVNLHKILQNANTATILPVNRNVEKDTRDFIVSGYYKYDVLNHAISHNNVSTHFMWMDFDLPKLFRDKEGVKEYLLWLSRLQLAPSFLTFPGCWNKLEAEKERDSIDSVHWRFCGGFFMGDRESISQFCQTVSDALPRFTEKYDTLVWDFNLWAWIESDGSHVSETHKWPDHWTWYRGDHNDSILNTSADIYTRTLNLESIIEYPYPTIDTYYPTSAA